MQPQRNDYSIPRRPLDLEDYIDVVRRHKAWILGPTFLGLVVAVVVAYLWPDTYVSTAVIRVVPAQVPEKFVPSNVSVEVSQRINSMATQILNRATLTNLIQTHNLYPSKRKNTPMEDIIEQMLKKDIKIGGVESEIRGQAGRISAFKVSFAYEDRFLAQKVTTDLVSRFIDENIRDRASKSVSTTQFLKDQWEAAKKSVDEIERKLADFRTRNMGRLPEQVQLNIQRLNSLESSLASVNAQITRSSNEKLLLESQLQTVKAQLKASSAPGESWTNEPVRSERLMELERDIANAKLNLAALRERYTDTHPDMQRATAQLAVLEKTRDALLAEESNKPEPPASPMARIQAAAQAKEARLLEATVKRLESEIQVKDLEVQDFTKQKARLEKEVAGARQQLLTTPASEGEYSLLLRDRELARKQFEELDMKKNQSELATDLENRRQSETLELLDPASLPQTPTAPKRWTIVLSGLGLGFVCGLALAGFWEAKDTSLKNLKDVRAYTQLTVLASIPLLENTLVVRRRRRLAMVAWTTVCLVGLLIMSASMLYYYSARNAVR